jgi:hypothetical protein
MQLEEPLQLQQVAMQAAEAAGSARVMGTADADFVY